MLFVFVRNAQANFRLHRVCKRNLDTHPSNLDRLTESFLPGVVPIYLSESSPPAFRASFAGIAYQLGNMASAGSAQIEARGGENWKVVVDGKVVPDYAKVQGEKDGGQYRTGRGTARRAHARCFRQVSCSAWSSRGP